jgi:hypothetical protein
VAASKTSFIVTAATAKSPSARAAAKRANTLRLASRCLAFGFAQRLHAQSPRDLRRNVEFRFHAMHSSILGRLSQVALAVTSRGSQVQNRVAGHPVSDFRQSVDNRAKIRARARDLGLSTNPKAPLPGVIDRIKLCAAAHCYIVIATATPAILPMRIPPMDA